MNKKRIQHADLKPGVGLLAKDGRLDYQVEKALDTRDGMLYHVADPRATYPGGRIKVYHLAEIRRYFWLQ